MQETLARWQFAFTTVDHFLFVPVTIGLAVLTAMPQTAWYRSSPETSGAGAASADGIRAAAGRPRRFFPGPAQDVPKSPLANEMKEGR